MKVSGNRPPWKLSDFGDLDNPDTPDNSDNSNNPIDNQDYVKIIDGFPSSFQEVWKYGPTWEWFDFGDPDNPDNPNNSEVMDGFVWNFQERLEIGHPGSD